MSTDERQHFELVAAQMVAALIQTGFPLTGAIKQGTEAARAIQAEVAAADEPSELSAICPVPPFPGIRGADALTWKEESTNG